MLSMKYKGYLIAIIVSLVYSLWYLLSGFLIHMAPKAPPIFPLMLIEGVSAIIVFVLAGGRFKTEKLSDLKYPVLSSIMYTLGNYLFYVVIANSGVPSASAFSTSEIVIFTLLIWLSTRRDINMSMYSFASVIIAAGLVLESLIVQNGVYLINITLVSLGILIAAFYGLATYLFYLSVKHIKSTLTTMFFVQAPQAAIYAVSLLLFVPISSIPTLTYTYALLAAIIGAVLFVSFYGENMMMKILNRAGKGAVTTGYILSDMQLIPIVVYYLIVNPSAWMTYAPGLLLVTLGLAMLDWR